MSNKKDRHWSTPILGAILRKNMWFGPDTGSTILIGDDFTMHCKSAGADLKNVILASSNYLIPPYTFPQLHTGNGKTYD